MAVLPIVLPIRARADGRRWTRAVDLQVSIGTDRGRQNRVHLGRGFPLQRRHDVRVGVQGQADLGVAERFHDRARVDSLGQQQCRRRMPEVVVANGGQPGVAKDRLEQPIHVATVKGCADRGREHEPGVVPFRAGRETLFALALPMSPQGNDHRFWNRDRTTTASRLRLGEPDSGPHFHQSETHIGQDRADSLARAPVLRGSQLVEQPAPLGRHPLAARGVAAGSFKRLAYRQLAFVQVHIVPPQPQGLAEPQSEREPDRDQCFEPMAAHGPQ